MVTSLYDFTSGVLEIRLEIGTQEVSSYFSYIVSSLTISEIKTAGDKSCNGLEVSIEGSLDVFKSSITTSDKYWSWSLSWSWSWNWCT